MSLSIRGTKTYIKRIEVTPILLSPTELTYQELSFSDKQANFLMSWDDVSSAASYKVYKKASYEQHFIVHKTIIHEEKRNAAVFEDGVETPPSKRIQTEMIAK